MEKSKDQTLIQAELAQRELARRYYRKYLSYVNTGWIESRFANYLADRVQSFVEAKTGNAYDILVVETPPQHGKSMTITEALPSWALGRHPTWRVIEASYNEETAERFCRRNKEKLSKIGKSLFGVSIGAINRATEFELDNGQGRMISRGIMSGITGNPANLLIIDDPIKNRVEADSDTLRGRVWDEWQNSLKSRLAAGAKVIVIMTPWHEDDIAARILQSEPNAELLRLPVEAEENDPLGRPPGAALCPELGKDDNWLKDFKDSYLKDPKGGTRAWSALYQCSPRVEGGNIVQRNWWSYYDPREISSFASSFISVDAAFKGGDKNDYVAITVWGKRGNNYYCRYCLNKHMDFPQTMQAIRTVRTLFPDAMAALIEDKANGPAIISVLQAELFCIPVNPQGGKVTRVHAVAPAIQSGHVLLPIGAPWIDEVIDQFSAFPAGAHDDIVDSCTQALAYMLFSSGYIGGAPPSEVEICASREEEAFLDGDRLFDVYSLPTDSLSRSYNPYSLF